MANETPKKPIRRTTVPTVPKDAPKLPAAGSESKTTQNVMLFVLFLLISGIVYLAIFQRPLLSKYLSSKSTTKPETIVTDSTGTDMATDSTRTEEEDELNTFIGQDKSSKKKNVVSPNGGNYYLVAGTFIFYPYAEKCRDRMKAQGYDADIITTGDKHKFHRVYIQSSTDGAAVRAKRDELHSAGNTEVWVYVE